MMKLQLRLIPEEFAEPLERRLEEAVAGALAKAMRKGLRAARARLAPGGGGPVSSSGRLARSISTKVVALGGGRWKGLLVAGAPYAGVQEFGALIRARTHPYLVFQVGGRWVRKREVRIPSRPFLRPGLEAAAAAFREEIARELER